MKIETQNQYMIELLQSNADLSRQNDDLKQINRTLHTELGNLFKVVEAGDWSVVKTKNPEGFMSVSYADCERACDRAEKALADNYSYFSVQQQLGLDPAP